MMLLHCSFSPNETAFVASLFRHAVHCTYYQVDLLICFSGRMLLVTWLDYQKWVAKLSIQLLQSLPSGWELPVLVDS